jgi:hypothetical protein
MGVAVALTVVAGGSVRADEPNGSDQAAKTKAPGRVSGVIVKVDKVAKKDSSAAPGRPAEHCLKLTINTAAVWRDWVRDQGNESPSQSVRKDAADGANSVATKGEPKSRQTLVTVEVGPDARVETRFRTPDDETRKGSKTPSAAAGGNAPSTRPSAKPTRFKAEDLRAGLFVEVDMRDAAKDAASTVAVIRPVLPK